MLNTLSFNGIVYALLIVLCSCGVSSSTVSFQDGYRLELNGGDTAYHKSGNLQLWHYERSDERVIVWNYLVSGLKVLPGAVVFSAGLTDDRRWKVYPAIFAYSPGGPAVDITELVTKKYCEDAALKYPTLTGAYRYRLATSSNEWVQLDGMKLPEVTTVGSQSIEVRISEGEIKSWIRNARAAGVTNEYRNVKFITPSVDKHLK